MARHPAVGLFLDQPPVKVPYGTDLGQVSQALPAIHPMIGFGGTATNNTAAFTPLADTDEAYARCWTEPSLWPRRSWTPPLTRI